MQVATQQKPWTNLIKAINKMQFMQFFYNNKKIKWMKMWKGKNKYIALQLQHIQHSAVASATDKNCLLSSELKWSDISRKLLHESRKIKLLGFLVKKCKLI